jgi:hypothetical protein
MQEKFACSPTERLGLATTLYGTVTLSFVIPSEAEGSAVFPGLQPPFTTRQPSSLYAIRSA